MKNPSEMTVPTSLTPATLSMNVLVFDRRRGATYVRLPTELWRSCGICRCSSCNGAEGYWDTLVIPAKGTTWTVHMPAESVAGFKSYIAEGK